MAGQVAPLDPGNPAGPRPAGFPSLATAGRAAALRLFIGKTLEWDDDPISKGRPRTRVQFGKDGRAFAQIYTDPRTREWEQYVEKQFRRQIQELAAIDDGQVLTLPFQGRVLMTCRFNLHRPKSIRKSVTVPLTAKGDVDNMAKAILDAAQNAELIANDRLVTDLLTYRRYADDEHPIGVEVDLTGLA